MSSAFVNHGVHLVGQSQKEMRKFADVLNRNNLIRPGSLTVIPKAKVPIIKFVEKETGLRVDISFENDSGMAAIRTFAQWKRDYPAMPPIVAVIKQYLAMRDQAEVATGGLGGFTVICLVVSTIHFLEETRGTDYTVNRLDVVLLAVLDRLGIKFKIRNQGLDMRNMRVIPKVGARISHAI